MSSVRIALANLRVAATPAESVELATAAVAEAGRQGARVVCFPECYVPGYRWPGSTLPPPDSEFLERAWAEVAAAARAAKLTVILGTERMQAARVEASTAILIARPPTESMSALLPPCPGRTVRCGAWARLPDKFAPFPAARRR
jgi:predicted amidohydrolase